MKLSFYSNYLSHHQLFFCNEMYRLLGNDYTFISTEEADSFRTQNGWELNESVPYELKAIKDKDSIQKALELSIASDVIMIGSAPEKFLKLRLRNRTDGITFRYSERIYKKKRWHFLSPRGILRIMNYYRYHKRKLYMLCASAYTSADLLLQGTYLGRCYKWGYFPETKHYEIPELISKKVGPIPNLLWCGRFIDWKHPKDALILAYKLKHDGIMFHLDMIGTGQQEDGLRTMIRDYDLESYVSLTGSMSPHQVRAYMENANIFLITSDFEEGWGAVVNEAMNSCCAVVASHAAGAVPYLIQDGSSGLIYESGNIASLHIKVLKLLQDRPLCESLGLAAYHTIISEWNAETAAARLLQLIEDLVEKGYSDRFSSGPCSKAIILKNTWYKEKGLKI
jgi:glycosyltransferase involved in cell wall biosynthesis